MPSGVYIRTEKLRLERRRIALEKGYGNWMKGKKHSVETKTKMSTIRKNKPCKGKPNCIDCDKKLSTYGAIYCKVHANAGGKNSAWKGGVTPANTLMRVKFRKTMQKLIFERDDYTCQLCGIKGVDLQVDHIQSWAEYVELRFSMDNCRTLCVDCHYLITFGKPKPKNVVWGHNLKKRRIQT